MKLVGLFQVLDQRGSMGGVCLVWEQSQVEMCQDSVVMSLGEGLKTLWRSADE